MMRDPAKSLFKIFSPGSIRPRFGCKRLRPPHRSFGYASSAFAFFAQDVIRMSLEERF